MTITTANGSKREITDKKSMDTAILENNEAKYHMTEGGSKLLSPNYVNLFGTFGDGPRVIDVLDGTMEYPADFDPWTKTFLDECKRLPTVSAHESTTLPDITDRYRDFKRSWETRKETTCTYKQHIGHYKAMMRHSSLSWLIFQRSEIPDHSGYSPNRHKQCVDLMILNKSQVYDIKKQRIIGILETEYNHSNRSLGRTAMRKALEHNAIATEQFSRPGRSSIDESILKSLCVDHQCYRRQSFSQTSVDLENNYDRIVHSAAAFALLRIGVSHAKIKSMFESIQKMVHRVRSAYGDSEGTYGGGDIGTWENFPQGILQGSACGPALWSIISSVIYKCLHKKGFSNFFCSALSQELFVLVGFSYVDDTDLFQTGASPIEVLEYMQALLNNFGSLMRVTGAAIATDKSWFYLIDYIWKKGKWTAYDPAMHLDLVATNDEGEEISLRRLCCSEAAEMLGIWMAPNFDESQQIAVLKSKSVAWGSKIRLGNAGQYEAWVALHTNMSARLKYALPACTLSKNTCTSIMFPAVKAALPRSGICATISTAIRDGPRTSGGLGTLSLWDYQGTSRSSYLVENRFRGTPLGSMMKILIEDIVQEIGLYGSLWSMNFADCCKYISHHSWIFHTCLFNFENNIQLRIKHTELAPQRINDHSIMALALQMYTSSSILKSINKVRIFHNIVHLSDITGANGSNLDSEFLHSSTYKGTRNNHNWPLKHHITAHDSRRWRSFLTDIYPTAPLRLPISLGSCLIPHSQCIQSWDWFISDNREFLFHRIKDTWHRHLKRPGTHRSFFHQHLIFNTTPSEHLAPASVLFTNGHLTLSNYSLQYHPLPDPVDPTFQIGPLLLKEIGQQCFLNNFSHSYSLASLSTHISEGTALAASDGSFFPSHHIGACGWIVSTPDLSEWIRGGCIIPGILDLHSTYRAELGGACRNCIFLCFFNHPS